jgi:hypothetical protein
MLPHRRPLGAGASGGGAGGLQIVAGTIYVPVQLAEPHAQGLEFEQEGGLGSKAASGASRSAVVGAEHSSTTQNS